MNKCNVENRTIFCHDNLEVLQGINTECIDLIYLDPPFNKNKVFTAPIGSSAEGASFKDIFREEDVKDEWIQSIKEDHEKIYNFLSAVKTYSNGNNYNYCYLCYMAIRLIEMHRILKPTGSLYLHCDPTMSHYLKLLLDCIFVENNFRNEIIWCYSRPSTPKQKQLSRVHNNIYWYVKSHKWTFNADPIRQKYAKSSTSREGYAGTSSKIASGSNVELHPKGKFPESWIYIPELKGNSLEYKGYPTQKPLALLERIIKASSNEGDLTLDPFCGCATTCVASEKLNRKWIGIDISHKAYELVTERISKEVYNPELPNDKDSDKYKYRIDTYQKTPPIFRTTPPKRNDEGKDTLEGKFVYVISHKNYPNEYKVGIAKNVKNRLNSYQTADPERAYKLEFDMVKENFRECEKHIHETFNNKHEWVMGNLKDIIKEIKEF